MYRRIAQIKSTDVVYDGIVGQRVVGSKGATPLRPDFSSVWARALDGAGLAGIHIHDLRRAGNHSAR